jgi:two-component sensor histidine kinase
MVWSSVRPYLTEDDIRQLQRMAEMLPSIADVCQADVFIDCAVSSEMDEAIVLAEAFPTTARSLYRMSVVGQMARAVNEPGVIACLQTGQPILGSRGISQERVSMEQNVIPIKNGSGRTIGTLILEKDITENVRQEQRVELLTETTERLGSTLMQLSLSEPWLSSLIQEGMILFDEHGTLTFANEKASFLLGKIGFTQSLPGCPAADFLFGSLLMETLAYGGVRFDEGWSGGTFLKLKTAAFVQNGRIVGGMLLISDHSDVKEKEQQLVVQSAVMKEIHHRVKNNLQTISSLLNLQSRRLEHPELRSAFRESINRINSIALVHDLLARQGLEETDAAELIDRISNLLVSSLAEPGRRIHLSLLADPLPVSSDQATQLALIVNELIQNSMSHAFSASDEGWIRMELQATPQEVTLVYQDSGPGFEPQEENSHLGLQIVRTLVQNGLRGELRHARVMDGFRLTITFPYGKRGDGDGSGTNRGH